MIKTSTLSNALSLLIMSCALSTVAQPTLTGAGCNPIIGDQLVYHQSDYVSPGAAGANQNWDLSTMTATALTSEFVTPASTPSPSIPNANISLQAGPSTYYYYKTNSVAMQNCSGYLNNSIVSYSDAEDALH